jgi:hypothetical protein
MVLDMRISPALVSDTKPPERLASMQKAASSSVAVARDRSATATRRQRDYCGGSQSSPTREPASMSDNQAFTASTTASSCVADRLRSNPLETSVLSRIWARSGDEDPGSIQARMMSSPVRLVVTAHRGRAA